MLFPLELAAANALCLLDVYLHCSSAGIDVNKFPCSSEGGVGAEQEQGVVSELGESKGMIAYIYALVLWVFGDESCKGFRDQQECHRGKGGNPEGFQIPS